MAVTIRPLRDVDLPIYYVWQEADPDWARYSCRPLEYIRPFHVFRARYRQAVEQGRQTVYSVLEDEQVVGRMVAFDLNPRNRSMEVGYYLAADARGRGIGQRAFALFVDVLFSLEALGLHKLYATTSAANAPSAVVLRRCGFHEDGRLRDHYLLAEGWSDQLFFSLLRDEWAEHRS